VSNINNQGELFLDMLTYNNDLFDKHFGPHPRYDPAHAPRLMQKKYLQELQDNLPDTFAQTSASPVRCACKRAIGMLAFVELVLAETSCSRWSKRY
jgi:hypothetical protein